MEEPAYGVLRGKIGRIQRSNVDPAWLAGEFLAAKIIGITDFQRATNAQEIAHKRLGELVGVVMGNGAPDVFQAFVSILLKEDNVKWLGEELKGRALSDPCHLHTYARFVSFQSVFAYFRNGFSFLQLTLLEQEVFGGKSLLHRYNLDPQVIIHLTLCSK